MSARALNPVRVQANPLSHTPQLTGGNKAISITLNGPKFKRFLPHQTSNTVWKIHCRIMGFAYNIKLGLELGERKHQKNAGGDMKMYAFVLIICLLDGNQ